jgi:hypothetical protein
MAIIEEVTLLNTHFYKDNAEDKRTRINCRKSKIYKYNEKYVVFFSNSFNTILYMMTVNEVVDIRDYFDRRKDDIIAKTIAEKILSGEIIRIPLKAGMYYKSITNFGREFENTFIIYDDKHIWISSHHSDEIILINLETKEQKIYNTGLCVKSMNYIQGNFFRLIIDENNPDLYGTNNYVSPKEVYKVYKWEQLLVLNANTESLGDEPANVHYFSIQWTNPLNPTTLYTIAKIVKNDSICMISYLDDNLECETTPVNILTLFNYTKMHNVIKYTTEFDINRFGSNGPCCEDHSYELNEKEYNIFFNINENCLLYYETCDAIENPQGGCVLCPGIENIYCYDFSTSQEIRFNNRKMRQYCTYGKPFRHENKVMLLLNEYYPASDWQTLIRPASEGIGPIRYWENGLL